MSRRLISALDRIV